MVQSWTEGIVNMRTSLYLVGFAAASIMGAGAVGFGCSSSSNGTTPPPADSGTPEASTDDSGGGGEGGGDDGGAEAAMMACTPAPVNIATFDAGSVWSCTQAACMSMGLAACGSDCTCNSAVFAALECVANDGGNSTTCFTNALSPVISDMTVLNFATCLMSKPVSNCAGPTDGGGGDSAPSTDGGTDSGTIVDAGGGG
jgi:hypothetical protein